MALFGQDQMDPRIARGGIALGDVLGGGADRRAERNGAKYEEQRYDTFRALEEASKSRAERLILDVQAKAMGMRENAIRADPELGKRADFNFSFLGADRSPNLKTHVDGLRALGDIEIDQQRQDAIKTGDIPAYNVLTALGSDKPYQPARVVAGNILPDGVALGDDAFSMVPLPQTLATIEQKEALGAAATTRANRAPLGGAQRAPKVQTAAAVEAGVLAEARNAISGGASVDAVKARLKERGYSKLGDRL